MTLPVLEAIPLRLTLEFPYGTEVVPDALTVPITVPLEDPVGRAKGVVTAGSPLALVETGEGGKG